MTLSLLLRLVVMTLSEKEYDACCAHAQHTHDGVCCPFLRQDRARLRVPLTSEITFIQLVEKECPRDQIDVILSTLRDRFMNNRTPVSPQYYNIG